MVGAVNPAHTLAYNTDIQPYPYDPEAAMALLEEAGWVDSDGDGVREKDGQRLEFTISYSDILLMFETTVLVAQDQLNDIGFDVTLEKVEWANYLSEILWGSIHGRHLDEQQRRHGRRAGSARFHGQPLWTDGYRHWQRRFQPRVLYQSRD